MWWSNEILRSVPRVAMAQRSTPIERRAEEYSDGARKVHHLDAVVTAIHHNKSVNTRIQ